MLRPRERWILDGTAIPPQFSSSEEAERAHREYLRWKHYEEQWRKFYREYEKAYQKAQELARKRVVKVKVSPNYVPKKGEMVEFDLVSKPITLNEIEYATLDVRIKKQIIEELRKKGIIVKKLDFFVETIDRWSAPGRLGWTYYEVRIHVHGIGVVDPAPVVIIAIVCATVIATAIGVAVSMIAWERKEFWVYKQKEIETVQKQLDVAKKLAEQGKVKEAMRIINNVNKQLEEIREEKPSSYVGTGVGAGIGAGIGGALLLLGFLAFASREGEKR